jgi:hypothetical protein
MTGIHQRRDPDRPMDTIDQPAGRTMPTDYREASRKEAEQIRKTLTELDALLASDRLTTVYASDASELRAQVSDLLKEFRTNLVFLEEVDRADVFGGDPIQAQRRFTLIRNLEGAKIVYDSQVLPALARLTSQIVEQAKAAPPGTLDVSALPPPESGERWTVERVVAAAERLVEQGSKAVGAATKGYALVKALGLLVGIPIP